ncbi:MAG: hypothetical protein HKP41_16405 [Desulfobacterales bacterium]|nr:hypothetical protein [Desulfobacterales bacterium]
MNKNDFRNPLIQSGALLLLVFILISIVAGSGEKGFFGSIGAMISGLFSGILFIVALTIAIIFSIAVLIGLYLAAVSIYSAEKARDLYGQLKVSLGTFYDKIPRRAKTPPAVVQDPATKPVATVVHPQEVPLEKAEAQLHKTEVKAMEQSVDTSAELLIQEQRCEELEQQVTELQNKSQALEAQITSLQQNLDDLQNQEIPEKLNTLDSSAEDISGKLAAQSSALENALNKLTDLETHINDKLETVLKDIGDLQEKTAAPELVTGILSYIDLPEDREVMTQKAEEAVSRGMTYAQIDEFFKKSLSSRIYKQLSEHPRLTKDFLRSIKKKFA